MAVPLGPGYRIHPSALERVSAASGSLLAVAEMYVQGVSTRKGRRHHRAALLYRDQQCSGQPGPPPLDAELKTWPTGPSARCPT